MISKLLFLFFAFISISNSKAFHKDFKIESDRLPTEFILLFDSMKTELRSQKEQIEFVGLIQELGENLGTLEKAQVFLLLKSEVIKNVLEHRFDKVRDFDMSNSLVDSLESDYDKKQKKLTPFAQWIWRSIISELKFRQKMGIITSKNFNPNSFEGTKLSDALKFQRYLKYIMPWIDRMDALSPTAFNELVKEVSWSILKRINDRSILFKRYASTLSTDTKVKLFNIPQSLLDIHPEEFKKIRSEDEKDESPTLKEQSSKAKDEASETMDKITPDDMSPMSDEVMEVLDKSITPRAKNP